jgi:hypothetical protein
MSQTNDDDSAWATTQDNFDAVWGAHMMLSEIPVDHNWWSIKEGKDLNLVKLELQIDRDPLHKAYVTALTEADRPLKRIHDSHIDNSMFI